MEPDDFHKLLRQAANRARRHRPSWLDTQDLTQAAELALLEAQAKGRVETVTDPSHLENKTRQRMFGAMIDAIRAAWGSRTVRVQHVDLPTDTDGTPLDVLAGPDDPLRHLQMKRAVERFAVKGTARQHEAITLRAAGFSVDETAAIMGVSASRVSQLLADSRKLLSLWGDL